MKKTYNYYGLKNGQKLGYELGRQESYYFVIFSGGSNAVTIRAKSGKTYIFGSIEYCRRMFKKGFIFQNKVEKQYIILKGFKKALAT